MFNVFVKTIDQTIEVAKCMAPALQLGDIILLKGWLASGKTYFVKSLASALGSTNSVTSPTYAIANFYDIKIGSLLHIDVYRLSGLPEFYDLGLEEFFPDSITVVEWGEKVSEAFPTYLSIEFTHVDFEKDYRKLTFSYVGDKWHPYIESLSRQLSHFEQ